MPGNGHPRTLGIHPARPNLTAVEPPVRASDASTRRTRGDSGRLGRGARVRSAGGRGHRGAPFGAGHRAKARGATHPDEMVKRTSELARIGHAVVTPCIHLDSCVRSSTTQVALSPGASPTTRPQVRQLLTRWPGPSPTPRTTVLAERLIVQSSDRLSAQTEWRVTPVTRITDAPCPPRPHHHRPAVAAGRRPSRSALNRRGCATRRYPGPVPLHDMPGHAQRRVGRPRATDTPLT